MFKDIFNLIVRVWRVLVFQFSPRCGACKNKLDKTNYWVPFRRGKANIGLFACSGKCCAELSKMSLGELSVMLGLVKVFYNNEYGDNKALMTTEQIRRLDNINNMIKSLYAAPIIYQKAKSADPYFIEVSE